MIVCICNAFNERQVRQAASAGARKPADVYRALGVRPQCGRCGPHMCSVLEQARCETADGKVA